MWVDNPIRPKKKCELIFLKIGYALCRLSWGQVNQAMDVHGIWHKKVSLSPSMWCTLDKHIITKLRWSSQVVDFDVFKISIWLYSKLISFDFHWWYCYFIAVVYKMTQKNSTCRKNNSNIIKRVSDQYISLRPEKEENRSAYFPL